MFLEKLQPVGCRYELYVDGSPGPKTGEGWAGWGIALVAGAYPLYEGCGVTAERVTTNAIELEALIQGLAFLLRAQIPSVITVWTDSRYVAEQVSRLPVLYAANFADEKGFEVQNADRLQFLYELLYEFGASRMCIIRHVKGHDGIFGNELADKLSKLAAYKGEVFYRENHIETPQAK